MAFYAPTKNKFFFKQNQVLGRSYLKMSDGLSRIENLS